jgi:hypothetical protein
MRLRCCWKNVSEPALCGSLSLSGLSKLPTDAFRAYRRSEIVHPPFVLVNVKWMTLE